MFYKLSNKRTIELMRRMGNVHSKMITMSKGLISSYMLFLYLPRR